MTAARAIVAWLGASLVLGLGPAAAAASSDPPANRSLSPQTEADCSNNPAGSACLASALADINAARASEGVRPMVLPSGFASMTVSVQLLNLANLERVDRGLAPILGLSAPLDRDAQTAAAQDEDPTPSNFYGDEATANWAAGYPSTLEADFAWMYDDGLGSGNLDCTSSNQSGCWGHRHDILWPFSSPIAMGAGYATGAYGPSMTELFVGGDTETGRGQADAPIAVPSPPAGSGANASSGGSAAASRGRSGSGASAAIPRTHVRRVAPAHDALRVTLACTGARGRTCRVTLRLLALPRSKGHGGASAAGARTLATVSVLIPTGHTRVIRLGLDPAARALLATHRALHPQLVITGGAQRQLLLSRPVTLAG